MQLPPNKSFLLRAGALCIAGLALSAALAPPEAQAKSRRAKTSTSKVPVSGPNAKTQALQARRRKAIATFNAAAGVVNARAVFLVQGKIQSGDAQRLVVYGRTYGQNSAAASALGQNNDESWLTIYRPDPQRIMQGLYQGHCIALSQTDFAPVPAAYYTAVATLDKYREIIASLESEIEFQKQVERQAIQNRKQQRVAKLQHAELARRDRVYGTRVALANKEAAAKLAQLDGAVAGASDKGGAYLQSSAAATALFNKWGNLGVPTRALMERAFEDLASAAAWQLERGDWKSAMQSAEKLLSLEVLARDQVDSATGRQRIELGIDASAPQMPSDAVGLAMRRNGKEPAAATRLARVWLEKLPGYIAGSATREEKLRVAKLSQLLGAEVFAADAGRTQTIALAVDELRGLYGPGALAVLSEYVPAVEAAKRARVARQVEAFKPPREVGAPAVSPGVSSPSVASPRAGASWMDREPLEDALPPAARANAPTVPATPQAPTQPQVQLPAPKPAARPLIPALDFTMRSFLNAKKVRLSDFKGKTVILYFWFLANESRDVTPSPAEQLFALSKQYDPKKVVLLLVHDGDMNSYILKRWKDVTDSGPGLEPERIYPREIYAVDQIGEAERAIAERVFAFYGGSKNPGNNPKRAVVIDPAGQVVGFVEFKLDWPATKFNFDKHLGGTENVYDFDKDAFEDLLVRARAPQP